MCSTAGAGPHHDRPPLHQHSTFGTTVHADEAAGRHVVVFASEPIDDDPNWRPLQSGELLHVDVELALNAVVALPQAPRRRITLDDLNERERASQAPGDPSRR